MQKSRNFLKIAIQVHLVIKYIIKVIFQIIGPDYSINCDTFGGINNFSGKIHSRKVKQVLRRRRI
jgi:hypothetical protein